ncbi:hypothetical protein BKP42_53370 [Rhodococcus erythropolis]|nr:hypothetical protein [Rhodococcus erythropolis]PBI91918.1 hypothetical protein BKP42_53370 [Rhodococcus erythropolis]
MCSVEPHFCNALPAAELRELVVAIANAPADGAAKRISNARDLPGDAAVRIELMFCKSPATMRFCVSLSIA